MRPCSKVNREPKDAKDILDELGSSATLHPTLPQLSRNITAGMLCALCDCIMHPSDQQPWYCITVYIYSLYYVVHSPDQLKGSGDSAEAMGDLFMSSNGGFEPALP